MRNVEETIGNFVRKASMVELSYINEEGYPIIKAMLKPRVIDGIKYFYLTTNTSSKKVACLRKNNKASLYFVNQRFFRGVCLTGNIEVLEDKTSKEMIWEEGDELFYPNGVTDPDYCVLRFTAKQGSYYANLKSESFEVK